MKKSLENYKLLNVTSRGFEQYGFEKGAGIEDHLQDSFNLAIFGIVKYYGELFKRITMASVTFGANNAFLNITKEKDNDVNIKGMDVTLINDNDQTPIEKDEQKFSNKENTLKELYISRSFSRAGAVRRTDQSSMFGVNRTRQGIVRRSI